MAGRIRIGIDIGGTFTDLQILDETTGARTSLKTPTTPDDPSLGLMTGLAGAGRRLGFALGEIGYLLHGTTIATNAVLERRLARGVLIATSGFRDVLEIGRHARRDIYALLPAREPALIGREHRLELEERVRFDGSVERAPDPEALAALMEAVARARPETVAVALLNAHVNPAHELAVRAALAARFPGLPVSLSSEISPEIREYERCSTTVLNALLVPVVRAYLDRLAQRLEQAGIGARLLLVQSNGGVCAREVAAAQPVRLLLSGPSGGALATRMAAARLGIGDLVGVDMGGTSFDVCVVRDGQVSLMAQGEVDGLPVRLPMVEIRTIGAGGGSIAAVAPGGRLTVGPRSAGASPGPACYGRGGQAPTVTDANLLLGRLDARTFLGGAMPLDVGAAAAAMGRAVGGPLGLVTEAAAEGVLRLANATLAAAIRLSLFEKGLDPRRFTLLSFGGAGGLHAIPVAEALGARRVAFPADASTFSASGILHSDIVHDLATSRVMWAEPAALPAIEAACAGLRAQAASLLDADAIPPERRRLSLAADLRYHGQAFELVVPWGDVTPSAATLAQLLDDFHNLHRQRFSYANPEERVELVTLRLTATGLLPIPAAQAAPAAALPPAAGVRRVYIDGAWREVAVHRRAGLTAPVAGPALIEEEYTTIFLAPGWRCGPAAGGDLVAERTEEEEPAAVEGAGEAHAALGPVEIEVLRNALTAAAAEMDVTIWRTSRSTVVRELLDYSTALFDPTGANIAQSARIPQHLNSMGAGLRTVLESFLPAERWQAGDVIITNDPYCGGQHIPDILAFRPVFVDRALVAIAGALCHHLDMGGMAAGSYAANATEIFQEGLRIPPLKLVRAGTINAEVLAMMRQNVRRPDMLWGDLQAQLAALAVGEAALLRLARATGPTRLVAACRRMLDGSEAAMRASIGRMPDGRYRFEDFLDDDGLGCGPIRIAAEVTIAGEQMEVDLGGSGPQALGPVNATLASSGSAVAYAVMAVADETIAPNDGCMRPVTIRARPGTIVHAAAPAPVANRIATTHILATTLLGALHPAAPDRVPAAYYGVSYVCTFQTIAEDGSRAVLVEIEVGGGGAHAGGDGPHAFSCGMHNNANIPIEMIESELPLTITEYALRPGSGGEGRHRGGAGLIREWRVESPEAVFTANLERFHHRPYGLEGGQAGAAGTLTLIRDGVRTALGSKVGNLRLRQGDRIRLETSGGGGYGDPALRPADTRERDRRRGL